MVKINECRITPDGLNIVISGLIMDLSYFENRYLDYITIDTQKDFDGILALGKVFIKSFEDDEKEFDIVIPLEGTENNLYFISIVEKGEVGSNAPCGVKDKVTTAVAYNGYRFYNKGMGYLKLLGNECTPANGFMNFILLKKAFELALLLGHYKEAIEYWELFYSNNKKTSIKTGCGCNG